MRVAALRIGAEPKRWRDLAFDVSADGVAIAGGVRIELETNAEQGKIVSWALEGLDVPGSIDGLATESATRGDSDATHPNGVVAIDHVVVVTPSLDRTTAAFAAIGVECRRVRNAGGGARQGFFLIGDLLIEVVEGTSLEPGDPARFWGLTAVVSDIDATAALLGDRLGRVKDAVQAGRRIATVRSEASGGLPLAFITPRQ
ncbi:MAG TPA: hypothetical protein VNI78_01155 [Vicinamibacterales bacterium]|nr:hypothetical protein [Vicinamibacterales bacterium]